MTASQMTDQLETSSLLYREPALYAEMTDDGAAPTSAAILALADRFGPADARSALDIGCGTGAVLERLAHRYTTAVGVDLLPGMVEIAKERRADLDVRTGDMRTVRLGSSFDVVTCVGNALSYLTASHDLAAAFRTFAEHCVPGGLLVLQTIASCPKLDKPKMSSAMADGRRANVTVAYSLEDGEETLVMRRRWEFDDGRCETDVVRRRVLPPDEQALFAAAAGFIPAAQGGNAPQDMTTFVRKGAPHV
jgi:SAM-dependent methyltransferase